MARVWTSRTGLLGGRNPRQAVPATNGPLATAWTSPTTWWSALWLTMRQLLTEQLVSVPKYQPQPGTMMTARLRLLRPVSDGRGSNVWLADHLALGVRVEVTFGESTATDPSLLRNELAEQARAFRDRADVAARINDPHVVLVVEQGEVGGVPFVVTKALEGKSLRTRLLHGPASLDEVQRVVRDAATTLGKAHSLGIAHGHLRPDCLFSTDVAGDAFLEIAGFGDADVSTASPADNPYASPEQLLHGTASDVRSDLWSLAVTVYELLTTTLPFEAATPAGVTVAICNAQFARPSHYRADLPPGIDGWFDIALAKDPARRFRDAAEFVRGFESALAAEAAELVAPPLPGDSLEMDDEDGDEDEKTVKWDMPEDARAIARESFSAGSPAVMQPAIRQPAVAHPAARAPNLAMVSTPGSVSAPPRASAGAVPVSVAIPPTLEPGVYLDAPFMASVVSALPMPNEAPEGGPAPLRRLFGVEGPLFTPDKTWLAALAFAAGVAVTWFAYDPGPDGEAVASGEAREDGPIRTLSVDDLPRVEGEEELPRIIQTSQLPRVADDDEAVGTVAARAAPGGERRAAPAQRVQALAPAAPKAVVVAAAAPAPAKAADSKTANCNPPYSFDSHGIRRLKSECLNGSGVIQGPYGAVLTTNVSAKTADSAKGPSEKQAHASGSCTPPYYFDGKIRRLKLDCL
jgi:serine/threonine protein kinase